MTTNHNEQSRLRQLLFSSKNQRWIIVVVTIVVSAVFIAIGNLQEEPGFPLDDSWIHQTYARNLAKSGRWEYVPGEVSAGSTSPLWTMLLSIGYLIGMKDPFIWTSFLSIASLTGMTLISYEIIKKITGDQKIFALAGSFLLVFDWHLLWSVGSGMETLLYCLLSLFIFYLLLGNINWIWISIVAGLIVWVRPDGITLLGPIFMIFGWKIIKKQIKSIEIVYLLFPLVILLFLYGWFNFSLSGKIFPNTFFAKQLEYASSLGLPLWKRLGQAFVIPVIGAGLFLIPGFVESLIQTIRKREIWLASIILWFLGYGILYAVKLPVVYQHGRYLFPLIPIFYIIGISGTYTLIKKNFAEKNALTKMIRLLNITIILCMILFVIVGEISFTSDIKTINRLMVDPALWIKENTSEDSIVAAHDIGAMGYFGERQIIDLAGLIEPDIIPIIRDEPKIKEYLLKEEANYLVVFIDWYDSLDSLGEEAATFELIGNNFNEVVEIRKLSRND
jgi:hypothetical protein